MSPEQRAIAILEHKVEVLQKITDRLIYYIEQSRTLDGIEYYMTDENGESLSQLNSEANDFNPQGDDNG